jgi:hypothetical protein
MSKRRFQHLGLACAVPVFLAVAVIFADDAYYHLNIPGDMNTGHEQLRCATCHVSQVGTARQQLQAQVDYWLGRRSDWIFFGTLPASNETCIGCHGRPDDRHPVYRFREPRFREARAAIGADQCSSCHREHNGVRVTQPATFCQTCHRDTTLKNDPIDVPHSTLIEQQRWETCLGCHDFHGNHDYPTPQRLQQATAPEMISRYLAGEGWLYSRSTRHPALSEEQPR